MWGTNRKAIGVGLPVFFRVHTMLPCSLDVGHRATDVFPCWFWSCSVWSLFAVLLLILEWACLYCATVSWEYIPCFLNFLQELTAKSLPWVSGETLNFDFSTRLEIWRPWGLLEMNWMHFALWDELKPFGRQSGVLRFKEMCQGDKDWTYEGEFWLSLWLNWETPILVKHTWVCLWDHFQKGLTKSGRAALNVVVPSYRLRALME
jgi:hypothetical protein